jgi:hypothetical protein
MKNMMTAIKILLVIAILTGAGIFVVNNWAWVFSKTVEGEIINVERVTEPTAILSARISDAQIHSYSILIKDKEGKLYTTSSEDPQWQIAKPGYCVRALLYRNPPWELNKAITFFNARIKELSECQGGKPVTPVQPSAPEGQPALPPVESGSVPGSESKPNH